MSDRPTSDDLSVLKAREQVMFDLHDALGVPFGSNPYTAIEGLLGLREENAKLREALEATTSELEDMLAVRSHCGDPEFECPMQDSHKPGSTEDIAKQARALLSTSSEKGEQG